MTRRSPACLPPASVNVDLPALRLELQQRAALYQLGRLLTLVGSPTRLKLLYALYRAGELCVCQLAELLGVSPPAVSQHLKILREKALVEARREAQTIYYRVCTANPFARLLVRLFDELELDHIQLNLNLKEEAQ